MNNDELLIKIKKTKNWIEEARKQLLYAEETLKDSFTVDEKGFKQNNFESIKRSVDNQIYYINNNIIPKINN